MKSWRGDRFCRADFDWMRHRVASLTEASFAFQSGACLACSDVCAAYLVCDHCGLICLATLLGFWHVCRPADLYCLSCQNGGRHEIVSKTFSIEFTLFESAVDQL